MNKKKLVFATPTNTSGGAERVITSIANYAADHGFDVSFVNFDKTSSFYELNSNVRIVKLGIEFGTSNRLKKIILSPFVELKRFRSVSQFLKDEKPDVVIAFLKTAEIIFGTNALLLNIPFITSIRNDLSSYKGVINIFRKIVFPKAALVVCQTKLVEKSLKKYINCNTVVLPNPLTLSAVNSNNYIGKIRKKKIVAVGRLCKQKNFPLLIDAVALVYKNHPELREYSLEIYGEGEERENIQALLNEKKLESVRLCGVIPNTLAKNNDAALYVMSSDFEGFPNTLIEAMANGIPSISTDFPSGAAKELIGDNNENGIIVPLKNAKVLSDAISYMLTNPNEAEKKAINALVKTSEYESETVCRHWIEKINLVLSM